MAIKMRLTLRVRAFDMLLSDLHDASGKRFVTQSWFGWPQLAQIWFWADEWLPPGNLLLTIWVHMLQCWRSQQVLVVCQADRHVTKCIKCIPVPADLHWKYNRKSFSGCCRVFIKSFFSISFWGGGRVWTGLSTWIRSDVSNAEIHVYYCRNHSIPPTKFRK